jgi:hypothetical protein
MKLWPTRQYTPPASKPEPKAAAPVPAERPVLPERPVRMYSLLLPPGFTPRD